MDFCQLGFLLGCGGGGGGDVMMEDICADILAEAGCI